MARIRGIDWGSYLTWNGLIQIPWKQMIENAGVQFFISKGDQEDLANGYSAKKNMQAAKDSGITINGCYYWSFGSGNVQYYIDRYSKAIDSEKPDFIYIDIEQAYDGYGNLISPQVLSDYNQALCEGISSRYPEKVVGIYSRRNFVPQYSPMMNKWLPKFDKTGFLASWPDYGLDIYSFSWDQILANKTKRNLDPYFTRKDLWEIVDISDWNPSNMEAWTDWSIWQYSSRMKYPYLGWPYDAQTDWCVFKGSLEDMKNWVNKKETVPTMASIYNVNTAQANRAKILTLEPTQKLANGVSPKDLGIDAVILPMGSMHNYDGSHWKVLTEGTFPGRFDLFNNSGIPVLGRFDLDAGSMLKEQHVASEFDGREIRDNWILPKLIDAWHIGAWTWDTILGKQGKWRDVKVIVLSMVETEGFPVGTMTPDDWQRRIFEYVYFHLIYLIDNGMAPKVPVVMYTGGWWLNLYKSIMGQTLANQKTKLYLHMGQWVNFSTATFNNLSELFAFPPADAFVFQTKDSTGKVVYTYPDGYFERILAHEFTGQYQKVKQIVDAAGNPSFVNLSLWCDTKEKMNEFLGVGTVPPVEPPVDPLLEARVKALEDENVALKSDLNATKESVGLLLNNDAWMKKFIQDVIDLYLKSIA